MREWQQALAEPTRIHELGNEERSPRPLCQRALGSLRHDRVALRAYNGASVVTAVVCNHSIAQIGDASDKPQLVILDIPDQGGYYVSEDKVDAEGIAAFVAKFKAGGLERKQLG